MLLNLLYTVQLHSIWRLVPRPLLKLKVIMCCTEYYISFKLKRTRTRTTVSSETLCKWVFVPSGVIHKCVGCFTYIFTIVISSINCVMTRLAYFIIITFIHQSDVVMLCYVCHYIMIDFWWWGGVPTNLGISFSTYLVNETLENESIYNKQIAL